MLLRTSRPLWLAAPLLLIAEPVHAQNMIADGGFDTQASGVAQFCYDSGCPTGVWSLYTGAGFVGQGNIDWLAPVPVSIADVAFLQASQAELRQSFTVPTTGTYVVTYWLASRGDYGVSAGNQTVRMKVAGQTVALNTLTSGQPFHRYVSSALTLSSGTSYLLQITGETVGDQTAFVDSVAVISAASTTSYQYDALGRLVQVNHSGGVNNGQTGTYTHDAAGNRTQVTATGAP